ncbi:MAG: M48 family metallopeptidase [Planctomycetota bacterium]|jgi:predicted Zn-dependent protease
MRRICLALLLAIVACKTSPYTGRSQLLLYSEEQMVGLGAKTYLDMTDPKKVKVSTDPQLTEPLQRVGRAISTAANKPDYKWEFKLIDDPKMANAWALPGGKIAFYTGIYPIVQDEAGMAIVMGHEVMHALLQHSNERMSQKTAAAAALAAAAIGTRNMSSGERAAILGALGVGATVGVILPYSRKHESESDEQGLYLAASAGYDPEAAIMVWERMDELSAGKRPPEFLSTHPETRRRIDNMKKWMPKAKEIYNQAKVKHSNKKLPDVPEARKRYEAARKEARKGATEGT